MSHLSSQPTPSVRLSLLARLGIVLGLSLALWLVAGGSLLGASRLPGSVDRLAKPASGGPALANDAGDETSYGFALQGPCDITVTNAGDSGPGTLRQAIADACDGGRITFAADYTIYLTTTLEITRQLTVDGETHAVNVSGDSGGDGTPNVRVFSIASSGVATLTHLSIVSGTASDGGGIYNGGTLTVTNSTLSANSTSNHGGGIFNYGTLTVQNSTLSANSTPAYGGGIYNLGALAVQNSTLSANSAYYGGGIYNNGTLTVQNSTLSANSASSEGGGLYNENWPNLSNTLIAHSPSGGDCWGGGVATNDHNLIADGSCSPAISGDPLLGPLAGNGGATHTHALLPGSPAIDAGNDGTCLATDQRGIPRPHGEACDIGAFESQGFIFLPVIHRLAH
jgi:hypothetical protein